MNPATVIEARRARHSDEAVAARRQALIDAVITYRVAAGRRRRGLMARQGPGVRAGQWKALRDAAGAILALADRRTPYAVDAVAVDALDRLVTALRAEHEAMTWGIATPDGAYHYRAGHRRPHPRRRDDVRVALAVALDALS